MSDRSRIDKGTRYHGVKKIEVLRVLRGQAYCRLESGAEGYLANAWLLSCTTRDPQTKIEEVAN